MLQSPKIRRGKGDVWRTVTAIGIMTASAKGASFSRNRMGHVTSAHPMTTQYQGTK